MLIGIAIIHTIIVIVIIATTVAVAVVIATRVIIVADSVVGGNSGITIAIVAVVEQFIGCTQAKGINKTRCT